MDTETLTSPAVEGTAVEPAAQEASPTTQVVAEPQETATTQVESGSNQPQVAEPSRRKASDYYQERRTIRELKETVSMLQKRMEEKPTLKESKTELPPAPDFDPAHFSPEHKRILLAREQALRDVYDAKIAAFEQRINAQQEAQANNEVERKHQEALEKLFPKTSPDSKESLQERVAKNPERAERIRELLLSTGLNELSKTNPDAAVKYALWEIGEGPKPTNATVLKKTLMGGNGTGNPGMGDKRSVTEQDLRAENKKLNDQLSENPSLRQDKKFMDRRVQILSDLERLVTKK